MRKLLIVIVTSVSAALLPTRAYADIYLTTDLWVDDDGANLLLTAYSQASDPDCWPDLLVTAEVLGPAGESLAAGNSSGNATCSDSTRADYSVPLESMAEGDYTGKGTATNQNGYHGCAMMQGNITRFRAVFAYAHPNGNLHEYSRICIHSCQPSRVCILDQAAYATFEGYKLVTSALTRCKATTPVLPSSIQPACIGSGVGTWTSYDSGCPF